MQMRGTEARHYLARPDPRRPGLLIHGADQTLVSLRRQDAVAALIGPDGDAEMRLTRIQGADLRRDPALLIDAVKATGFFPGPRVALIEDAGDGLTAIIAEALGDWNEGDAVIIATAGQLATKSKLRVLFQTHPSAVAIALYGDPPDRGEIESELKRAGLAVLPPDSLADLVTLAQALTPADFRQLLEKIALYKWQDPSPLSPQEIAALAPATIETDVDELLNAVAFHRVAAIGPLIRRLEGQGVQPVGLCIQAQRHFRSLLTAACHPGGAQQGLAQARIFGPRRQQMQNQLREWRPEGLERAMSRLLDADLQLRSSTRAPLMALVERALVQIASRG